MNRLFAFGASFAVSAALIGCGNSADSDSDPTPTTAATPSVAASPTRPSNDTTPVSQPSTSTPTATATTPNAPAATPTATATQAAPAPTNTPVITNPTPVPPTPTPPPSSGNPLSATVGVTGTARYFWAPAFVTVAPGGSVTFAWSGGAAHDLSLPGLGFAGSQEVSFSQTFTFPTPGKYTFSCIVHKDTMNGTVTVQ